LQRANDLFAWVAVAAGELSVRVDKTFPLAQAAEAHRYLESRQSKGKALLIPWCEPKVTHRRHEMTRARLRDLRITIGTWPTGPHNAITDVPGVWVEHRR